MSQLRSPGTGAEIRLELKRLGSPVPPNDAWIAALARQHGLAVLSNDGRFDSVRGVRRIVFRAADTVVTSARMLLQPFGA